MSYLAYKNYFSGGGGSAAPTVTTETIFNSDSERDNYFSGNPSALKEGVYSVVGGALQQYIDGVWVDVSTVVQGPSGESAPAVIFQYSEDGETNWTTTLNKEIHFYWRWSTDGGSVWSPNGIKFQDAPAQEVPETGLYYYANTLPTQFIEAETWTTMLNDGEGNSVTQYGLDELGAVLDGATGHILFDKLSGGMKLISVTLSVLSLQQIISSTS